MPSEDLHKPLRSINETIASLREDVQSLTREVKKVHKVVREAAETIQDAIQETIRAQAELKLMEQMMEVRAVKPQIAAEREQVETERQELEKRLEQIDERYQRRQQELDQKASERIREVGSHIFEVDEEQFEEGIEEPFTEMVTTTWQFLQAHNEDVRDHRRTQVQETTEGVVSSIDQFVDRQEALVDTIRDHRLDIENVPVSGEQLERLQLPYYVVEYEVDGVTQRETVVPSTLSTERDTDWCSVSLTPVEGAEQMMGGMSSISDPSSPESLSSTELLANIEEYGASPRLGVSYADAVADTVPEGDSIPVYVEGGED